MLRLLRAALALALLAPLARPGDLRSGPWRAWLASPGGELPFGLDITAEQGVIGATIVNGPERIAVPAAFVQDGRLVLDIGYYASRIEASIEDGGTRLAGEWTKRATGGGLARLPFAAEAGAAPRFRPLEGEAASDPTGPAMIDGRWSATFEKSADPSVALLHASPDGTVAGTFLTTTGDYRFLAGSIEAGRLRLSAFDGAHAFLLDARLSETGELAGDFWSRDTWHETWKAVRDPEAKLPDAWQLTGLRDDFPLALHAFPDLRGNRFSLADPAFHGRVRIVHLFGSWCPNCHDEAAVLSEIAAKNRATDLVIVGLAFELSGDPELDGAQVRKFAELHELKHLMMLGGSADKELASQAVPGLERVAAFPTTIFLDRVGRVRAVHTGFSGPGTGEAYEQLRREMQTMVAELVLEATPADDVVWKALLQDMWRDAEADTLTTFKHDGEGTGSFEETPFFRFGNPNQKRATVGSWLVSGSSLYTRVDPEKAGDASTVSIWHFEPRASVLLDEDDFGHRLVPATRPIIPVVDGVGVDAPADLVAALRSQDAVMRREAVYNVARCVAEGELAEVAFDPTPLIADVDPWVRCTAAWAAGHCKVEASRAALVKSLDHGHAPLRREAARALAKLGPATSVEAQESTRKALEKRLADYDPLVRDAARGAIAALDKR